MAEPDPDGRGGDDGRLVTLEPDGRDGADGLPMLPDGCRGVERSWGCGRLLKDRLWVRRLK